MLRGAWNWNAVQKRLQWHRNVTRHVVNMLAWLTRGYNEPCIVTSLKASSGSRFELRTHHQCRVFIDSDLKFVCNIQLRFVHACSRRFVGDKRTPEMCMRSAIEKTFSAACECARTFLEQIREAKLKNLGQDPQQKITTVPTYRRVLLPQTWPW